MLSRKPSTNSQTILLTIDDRAVATGPAAAGPMFGRIHKFSTTVFEYIRHLLVFENYTPDRLGLNAVGVARIFGPHVRLLCKMHEIW